jgi:ligand-binding sensor domain-containing protein
LWPENEKTIWIGIAGRGLVRLDVENEKLSSYVNQTQDDDTFMDDNTVLSIADDGNSLLLGTKNGLWIFNKENYSFSRPRCPDDECNAVKVVK